MSHETLHRVCLLKTVLVHGGAVWLTSLSSTSKGREETVLPSVSVRSRSWTGASLAAC